MDASYLVFCLGIRVYYKSPHRHWVAKRICMLLLEMLGQIFQQHLRLAEKLLVAGVVEWVEEEWLVKMVLWLLLQQKILSQM